MIKRALFIFLILSDFILTSQNLKDSVKIQSSWYSRITPCSVYAGYGTMNNRINQNVEFGRSIGVIDIGLAVGRLSLKSDTSYFSEFKVTMDACQYGIFSNEFSIGAGYVFNSRTPILLDISSTILAQINPKIGVGIIIGYYDISGETYGFSKNYFGLFIRFGLLRSEGGILLNKRVHHIHHHH